MTQTAADLPFEDNDRIRLTGKLANHFGADDLPKWMYRQNYRSAVNVLTNLDKFPKADEATLQWLVDAMFEHDPICALDGL